jgi:hypothetical protein
MLVLGGAPGCDLFQPADPAPPVGPGITVNYSDPDQTLETLAKGVEAKGSGQSAYTGAFADSTVDSVPYYASFDPELVRRYEAPGRRVPTWNLDSERHFFVDLAGLRSENYSMRWSTDQRQLSDDRDNEAGTATLYRRYEIFAIAPDGTSLGYVVLGLATIGFQRVSPGRWAIVRWDDLVDPYTDTSGNDPYNLTMGARRLGIR